MASDENHNRAQRMTSVSSESTADEMEPPQEEINREKIMTNVHNFATMREIVASPDTAVHHPSHHSATHSFSMESASDEHPPEDHPDQPPFNMTTSATHMSATHVSATQMTRIVNATPNVHSPNVHSPDPHAHSPIPHANDHHISFAEIPADGRPRNMSSLHKVMSPPEHHNGDPHYHHAIAGHNNGDTTAHNHNASLVMPTSSNPATANDVHQASVLIHNRPTIGTIDPLAQHIELQHHGNKKYKSRAGRISKKHGAAGLQTPQSTQSNISQYRDRRSSSATHPNTEFHNQLHGHVKDEEFRKHREEVRVVGCDPCLC